ncbi:hypothetical protein ILYODFUR_021711 [Ilyodon furcidens]|uniref:Secreted protein n=1 Tax=Ilyodon furcidens TaxID=33524 RepID=A0ABV0T0E6_9TELE
MLQTSLVFTHLIACKTWPGVQNLSMGCGGTQLPPRRPDRRGKRAEVFCWQKTNSNWIQEAIRSSIICKVK